jgi:ABC-2 type transport system permease protein
VSNSIERIRTLALVGQSGSGKTSLVAPIARWAMVLGKLLGGTLIALVQAAVFLALGLTLSLEFSPLSLLINLS